MAEFPGSCFSWRIGQPNTETSRSGKGKVAQMRMMAEVAAVFGERMIPPAHPSHSPDNTSGRDGNRITFTKAFWFVASPDSNGQEPWYLIIVNSRQNGQKNGAAW
jgi:hypothetical protein